MELSRNALGPRKFEWRSTHVIRKQIVVIDDWGIYCEITFKRMLHDFADGMSILIQAIAWCRQTASHYLYQFCPIPCHYTTMSYKKNLIMASNVESISMTQRRHDCATW